MDAFKTGTVTECQRPDGQLVWVSIRGRLRRVSRRRARAALSAADRRCFRDFIGR